MADNPNLFALVSDSVSPPPLLPKQPLVRRKVAIHAVPSNRNADERFWNIGHWAELIRMSDADFGLIGTVEDRKHYNRLWSLVGDASDKLYDCTGQSLDFVALYLRTVDCLVCVNSGIMHIAVLVGCPVVAIVGGTPARIILPPDNPKVKWIEDPELKWWDEHAEHGPRASRLNEIMPQQVYAKILELE